MRDDGTTSPVSFRVHVGRLPRKGMPIVIEADEAQRDALARDYALVSVESFRADLAVTDWSRGGISVIGRVVADIVQSCVVTLEPIEAHIDEDIEAVFVPERSAIARPDWSAEGELVLSADGPDMPEVLTGDEIDVGAVAEEHFALAIDLYPRKAGAAVPASDEPAPETQSPFARLAELKRTKG